MGGEPPLEVLPLPALLRTPAYLGQGQQAGEDEVVDILQVGNRLTPQRRLDAENVAVRHPLGHRSRIPEVG